MGELGQRFATVSIHTRTRTNDPALTPPHPSPRYPLSVKERPRVSRTRDKRAAGFAKGGGLDLGIVHLARQIVPRSSNRRVDLGGRAEGRGCDTVLFSDWSRDTIIRDRNQANLARENPRRCKRL